MDISQEHVIIAPGSKPLLFALFDILEGDVLLPRACWVSYEPQVKHARKRMFWVEPDEHDRHTLSSVWFISASVSYPLFSHCYRNRTGRSLPSCNRSWSKSGYNFGQQSFESFWSRVFIIDSLRDCRILLQQRHHSHFRRDILGTVFFSMGSSDEPFQAIQG